MTARALETGGRLNVHTYNTFQAYCNAVSDTFFPIEFRLKDEASGDFFSQFEMSRLGTLDVTRALVRGNPRGHRGRDLIDSKTPDQFILNIVRSGHVRISQFGRQIELTSGFMMLVDSRYPSDTEQLTTTDAIYIRIPGAPLRSLLGTPEEYCAIPIDGSRGLGAVFCGFLFSAWREREALDAEHHDGIAQQTVDLLSAVCKSAGERPSSRRGHPSLLIVERACRFIEANLGDSELNPDRIAKALRISRGHLHASFGQHDLTVGKTILSKRLEYCRQLLGHAHLAHRSITEIAFDCGFSDAAHFSRGFKAMFGQCPRQYRREQRAASEAAAIA